VVFDPVLRATWDLGWMARIAAYVVGLTLLAALYPAIKAGRVTPAEAMRHY
jgi:ABC-type lipoprotein release transport system permease subunit